MRRATEQPAREWEWQFGENQEVEVVLWVVNEWDGEALSILQGLGDPLDGTRRGGSEPRIVHEDGCYRLSTLSSFAVIYVAVHDADEWIGQHFLNKDRVIA